MRIYEMFMGPLEVSKPWSTSGISGVHRFLDRVWRLSERQLTDDPPPAELLRTLHKTIRKVTDDTGSLAFNTAIAQMMICVNEMFKEKKLYRAVFEPFILLLCPYAPHLAEELWERMGKEPSVSRQPWPAWDENLAADTEIEVVVQINGKVRSKIQMAAGTEPEELKKAALSAPRIEELTEGKDVVKIITVPDKLVNIVVR
jgi:leucyl-tRNA synthetase